MKFNILILLSITLFFSCKSPEARKPISVKTGSFIKKSAERNKELNIKEYEHIQNVIINKSDKEYIASNSGFWYTYIKKSDTLTYTPQFGDIVNYDYNIKTLEGEILYSKEELRTQNYSIDQQELFMGLREGLKLLKSGESVTFVFPSQIAFGYYGDENKIGTNIPIICDVTVNNITINTNK
ncbi:gliding motility-associated peptidyl-prolyl isomerase GldI [Aurantibacter sp.]|uniref:gliding motility-associated peptidyl-prolyl isomerase GldI n=1 Tax=Aurantibacter sp. TaxID=2807103 RepID=UPI0035C79B8C